MAIPANIVSELTFLSNQLSANQPLTAANRNTITAIQINSDKLLTDLDIAEANAAGQLDTWVQPGDPFALVSSLLGLGTSANDQLSLNDIKSFVGRADSNLDQL